MSDEETECKIEQQRGVCNPISSEVHHSSHDLAPNAQPEETLPLIHSNSPHFFFGNKNGLKPLFELLTLKDLCALRQTCKQFKEVIDEFIVYNYPAVRIGYRQIDICYGDLEKYVGLDENSIKVIKRLQVFTDNFPCLWDEVPDLLRQVEMVKLRNWSIRGEFYEAFLQQIYSYGTFMWIKSWAPAMNGYFVTTRVSNILHWMKVISLLEVVVKSLN